jgi:hypothetical protein
LNLPQKQAMAKIMELTREHFHAGVVIVIADMPTAAPMDNPPHQVHYEIHGSQIASIGMLSVAEAHVKRAAFGV